jgi:outer membrane protein
LASGFALSAAAQTPAAPAPPAAPAGPSKIAVINFQAAVGQTNEFQRNYADVQKKFDPKIQKIKSDQEEIEKLQKALQDQGDKLSDSDRASRSRTIDEKQKQAKRNMEDVKGDFQQQMQEGFGDVAKKVGALLTDYAKEQGYTLVLDVSERPQEAPVVLFASESTNITKTIIDAYNQKSGIPAPEPKAAAAPKPAVKAPVVKEAPPAH